MKRLLLLTITMISMLVAGAQTKAGITTKSRKSALKTESKTNAGVEKMQLERQQSAANQQAERIRYDSVRHENERLADEKFESERIQWKEGKIREMDSFYQEKWKSESLDKEQLLKIQRQRDEINGVAKLDSYKSRQVNYINQTYHDQARSVREDSLLSEEQKREQYINLNTERRARIRAVVGKSKERKIEKVRKTYSQKNTDDAEAAWINEIDEFAVHK